ncbi:hypothetical protein pb186bvf_011307 [Paramecium bursaria]
MLNAYEEFYENKQLEEFLDDDSILQMKDGGFQQFLQQNPKILSDMLLYFRTDEFETDHRILIKYEIEIKSKRFPFVVSELLGQTYAFQEDHLSYFANLFAIPNLPAIIVGHLSKILLNILKNEPLKFWNVLTEEFSQHILLYLSDPCMWDSIYSLIIFQVNDNQLEIINNRQELFNKILVRITDHRYSEGASYILQQILQTNQEQIQEQKQYFINKIIINIPFLVQNQSQNQNTIGQVILKLFIKAQEELKQNISILVLLEQLKTDDQIFGSGRLITLEIIEQYLILNPITELFIQSQLINILLKLITQYENNNRMHQLITRILLLLIKQQLDQTLIDAIIPYLINLLDKKLPYRGYSNKMHNYRDSII